MIRNNLLLYLKTGKTKFERQVIEKELVTELNNYINSDSKAFINSERVDLIHYNRIIGGFNTPYFIEVVKPDPKEHGYHLFLKTPRTSNLPLNYHSEMVKMYCEIKRNLNNSTYLWIGDISIDENGQGNGFSKDFFTIAISIAENNHCRFIQGSLTYDDLNNNEYLLDYFKRMGFKVNETFDWGVMLKLDLLH